MGSLRSLLLITGLFYLSFAKSRIKLWTVKGSFNDPNQWDKGRLPCSKDRIIFPDEMSSSVLIIQQSKIKEVVLPIDGEIFFSYDGEFEFFETSEEDYCPGEDVAFKNIPIGKWESPTNWKSEVEGEVVPHVERIPCNYDTVVLPSLNASFTINLPPFSVNLFIIQFGEKFGSILEMWGEIWINYLYSNEGLAQFIGQNLVDVNREKCTETKGCECGTYQYKNLICNSMTCNEIPPCIDPILPHGFCCSICGSYLQYQIESEFSFEKMETFLEKVIDQNVEWYLSREGSLIQIVIADKGSYEAVSPKVALHLDNILLSEKSLKIKRYKILSSGLRYVPVKAGTKVLYFFWTLFMAVTAIVCLALYFYRDEVMDWRTILRNRQMMFARFENLTGEVELFPERCEENEENPMGEHDIRSFDNPLYSRPLSQDDAEFTPIYSEILAKQEMEEISMGSPEGGNV